MPLARPEVLVNCAVSIDGRLAYSGGKPAALSGPEDLARVHRIRAEVDAILVGVGTIIADDPSLRPKPELAGTTPERPPMRVVLDGSGRTPDGARVLDGSVPTLIATSRRSRRSYPPSVEVEVLGEATVDLLRLWTRLGERGVRRVLVEGGSHVLASVARSQVFDRWTVYVAPVLIGGPTAPSLATGAEVFGPQGLVRLRLVTLEPLGEGALLTFVPGG